MCSATTGSSSFELGWFLREQEESASVGSTQWAEQPTSDLQFEAERAHSGPGLQRVDS